MATVSTGIVFDSNIMNLKEIKVPGIRSEVFSMLVEGEEAVLAFQTVRDQVVFTNKRIIVVNVQGITGKKVSYFSYPFSKVQYFGVETAGVLDIDCELILVFSSGGKLSLDFKSHVDIQKINSLIAKYVM